MPQSYLQRLPDHLKASGSHEKGEIELLTPDATEAGYGVIYEDKFILLLRDKVRFPDGSVGGYIRILNQSDLTGSSGTVIIPVLGNSILFIRTFRHANREWCWELPRGFQEEDISETDNAAKELREELGGEVTEISRLGEINPNTGLTAGRVGVFRALMKPGSIESASPEGSESIRGWKAVEINRLGPFIASGAITCGISLAALMMNQSHGRP